MLGVRSLIGHYYQQMTSTFGLQPYVPGAGNAQACYKVQLNVRQTVCGIAPSIMRCRHQLLYNLMHTAEGFAGPQGLSISLCPAAQLQARKQHTLSLLANAPATGHLNCRCCSCSWAFITTRAIRSWPMQGPTRNDQITQGR